MVTRRTIVSQGRLGAREIRLEAARAGRHGVQVMSLERLVTRLAGGFVTGVEPEALRSVVQAALPVTDLGELDGIKNLPGFVGAAADTLLKAWRSGLDIPSRARDHRRLAAIAELEAAVVARLPPSMLRPRDLATLAMARMGHAPALFGRVEIFGRSELSPCWRDLLIALAGTVPLRWEAGPRAVPGWLAGSQIEVATSAPCAPAVEAVTCATALHEAVEALRWARELVATGRARPHEIAIATAAPTEYDDAFLGLRADANVDLHFVHGVPVASGRPGQAAAALADVLVRGLTQTRLRRLASLLAREPGPFGMLPVGWMRLMPADAPLSSLASWDRLLAGLAPADWPDGIDHAPGLRAVLAMLAGGTDAARDVGETLLRDAALRVWRRALDLGSPAAIDLTIAQLRLDDGSEPCTSMVWMPASALAASPRRFVRLLGLSSSQWPRRLAEDRLVPDHVVPLHELDPLPVSASDRRDFETILATTADAVVLSRARRDEEGRLLGASPLLRNRPAAAYLRRNRRPAHAMSETDRLLARPQDFAVEPQAASAAECSANWRSSRITPHDGQVRPGHPALLAALGRVQSASSLKLLLRNPLGFAWKYALGMRAPATAEAALTLDARESGELLHRLLEHAVRRLEADGGFSTTDEQSCADALEVASSAVAAAWEGVRGAPPGVVWRRTLEDARQVAATALFHRGEPLPGQRAHCEVPFGGQPPKSEAPPPWDADAVVEIADTGFRISGYVDRLDLSSCGTRARVVDYKGGRCPREPVTLGGGNELQRCLYAYAVRALVGERVQVEAALVYPRDRTVRPLADPAATMTALAGHLRAARESLVAGRALMGPDTAGAYDELAFALPAMGAEGWCKRKGGPARDAMGDAALVWEAH